MNLGILKEIKEGENRVILTPSEVHTIVNDKHKVYVQKSAGTNSGFEDSEYINSGAIILNSAKEIYQTCDLIAKVKEIQKSEYELLQENQIIFSCIHPAAHNEEVNALLNKKVIAFTAEDSHKHGSPNSEAAGKAGAFMGLYGMLKINGGCGKFASGLGGAPNINALVLGCGIVGKAAINTLYSMGAYIHVCATNVNHLKAVSEKYNGKISTFISNRYNIEKLLPNIDLVVNCVKWPKDSTEFLITRKMVSSMRKGSVIVDISCDDGVIETFHKTTHKNPFYIDEGVVHYCVENIPALISGSTSVAYAASILPHIRNIMNLGVKKACEKDCFLRRSLTTYKGYLTHEETSGIQKRPWVLPEVILDLNPKNINHAPKATSTESNFFYPEYENKCKNFKYTK